MNWPVSSAKHKSLQIVADAALGVSRLIKTESEYDLQVVELPGREIDSSAIRQADVLLVRSITRVDATLLQGTNVAFVGSATTGCDHIDLDCLASRQVEFAHAPGCNANAVVDYVMAALLEHFGSEELRQSTVAIIGYGNIGSRLDACLGHFGVATKIYDPLVEVPAERRIKHIDEALACNALSLHIPLSLGGAYATHHLIGQGELCGLQDSCLLINSSRGPVVDNEALRTRLLSGARLAVALDVWEHEPAIDARLLELVSYCTGHIAGYSLPAKRRSLDVVLGALCSYLEKRRCINLSLDSHAGIEDGLRHFTAFDSLEEFAPTLRSVFCLAEESRRFRQSLLSSETIGNVEALAAAFDAYRRHYPLRAEIDYRVEPPQ